MIRLKISKYDQSHILLEALEGIDHFGFGTFLCDLKPTEIECDGFSKESIINSDVEEKAKEMGYDGIKYGDIMVQGLN